MKILQINKFFYRRGGADHHYFDLMDLLKENGETVVPFSMFDPRNERSEYASSFVSSLELGNVGWKKIFSAGRVLYSFEAKRKLAKLIREIKPDVAHLHLFYHHLSPSILVALRKARVPVVMTIHDWKALCPNYILYTENAPCIRCVDRKYIHAAQHRCIHRKFWPSLFASLEAYVHHARKYYENYVDTFIAPSIFVRDMFVNFGWPKEKIVVLPHFLPASFPRVVEASSAPAPTRFAYIGRLAEEKGIIELVRYWKVNEVPYQLDVYGTGPLEESLKSLATNVSTITFHGAVPREDLFLHLAATTAVIVPSVFYETFGLVITEALARGIPVVAHRIGALPELIKASGAGVLFDWKSGGQTLSDALDEVLQNTAFREAGVRYMNAQHQPADYYASLMQIYRSTIDKAV